MASSHHVKIQDVCQIGSPGDSPESATGFSLPLTYIDLYWFRFPPVERLFFYQLTELTSTPHFFNSVILPQLKHSLSATLLHFLPVAGRLTWPTNYPTPTLLYTPHDAVSLTVAVSSADFHRLSSNGTRDSVQFHPYVPRLPVSETEASVVAFQITLFPNTGFSIGYAINHSVLDGKSISMFMKAWAHLCRSKDFESLLPEHTPIFDRTGIKDPLDLSTLFLKWREEDEEHRENPRSFKLLHHIYIGETSCEVRATFELTREHINKLREKVTSSSSDTVNKPLHLSTFVLTCAYVLVCAVRSRGLKGGTMVSLLFSVDCRGRLDPPLPTNYFGNGIGYRTLTMLAGDLTQENAVCVVAEGISGIIKGLEKDKRPFEIEKMMEAKGLEGAVQIGIAGATHLGVYETDFGWGKPKKVEITSIDRTGAISMTDSRDGVGGVEVGLALKRHEMEVFASLFERGFNEL